MCRRIDYRNAVQREEREKTEAQSVRTEADKVASLRQAWTGKYTKETDQ